MILFTGKGSSGSWQVRGNQLGNAVGVAKPKAHRKDLDKATAIVAVKRIPPDTLEAIRASRKPWVWDIVDAYPQPRCTSWTRGRAIAWCKDQLKLYQPTGVVWPTQQMREDCDTGLPGAVIPHHYRPDTDRQPIRQSISTVCYEGSPGYLGKWATQLIALCKRRGWDFAINSSRRADVVVAFRDDHVNGYVQRHWKSNVKLANAHGAGIPFVGQSESGYIETASGAEKWVNSPKELDAALDSLEPYPVRQAIHGRFIDHAIPLDRVAKQMRDFINGL